jgi:hypothetical protein
MPKKSRRIRSFYIDTNVALDYATNRDIQTVLVMERIKEKGWKCISSTFLAMEMADYQKDYIYISKEISKKRNPDDILRSKGGKNLNVSNFEETEGWFADFHRRLGNLTFYDFIVDSNAWTLAKDIGFNSNLSAPDVIHLVSAILGSINGYCEILLTKDGVLRKEADRTISRLKSKDATLRRILKLRVMDPSEVKKTFLHDRVQ